MTGRVGAKVAVLDIRLVGENGLEACRQIKAQQPKTRIMVLTSFPDDEGLFDAIACEAEGYILKQVGSDDLIRASERVGRGESLLDPASRSEFSPKYGKCGSGSDPMPLRT
ncbi:MAG: response regulator [Anaerolineae bacterium]